MSITLIGDLKQANGQDFPLIDSNDIKGGLYTVDTVDEMNILPTKRLKEGMLCYVAGTVNKFYQYINANWVIWKVGFDTAETFSDLDNKTIIASIKANAGSITKVDTDYKAAVNELQQQINAITGTSEGGDATTIEGLNAQLSSLKTLIGKEADDDNEATGLIKDLRKAETDITTLKNAIGDDSSGLTKKVNDNTVNINSNTNAISSINNETTGILAKAKKYVDDKNYATNADLTTLNGKVTTNTSDISTIKNNINTINGTSDGSISKALSDANDYTDTKVAGIVNSAPETLDTLNELATALGNDPNFATTVATNIGTKANQTDLDSEVSSRQSADNTLSGRLDTLETKVDLTGEDTLTSYVSSQISTKADKTDVNAINEKIAGFSDTTVKSYIDTQDTGITNRVSALETSLGTNGSENSISSRVSSLESSMAVIQGNENTEGSMAKLKSDLTSTIATTVNNLNLSIDNPTETDNAYKIKLNLSDTNISSADLTLETVTESDVQSILSALA